MVTKKKDKESITITGDSTPDTTSSPFPLLRYTNLFNLCTLSFVFKLLKFGSKETITYQQIPPVENNEISEEFWKGFQPALQDWLSKGKGNLFQLYFKLKKKEIFLAGIFDLLFGALAFAQPVLIKEVTIFLDEEKESVGESFLLSGLFLLSFLLSLNCLGIGLYWGFRLQYYVQSTLSTAIMFKASNLSNPSRAKKPVAVIVNHLSTDMKTCVDGFGQFIYCWWAAISLILACVLLSFTVGVLPLVACLSVALLLCPISIQSVSKYFQYFGRKMEFSDKRLRFISDIVNGIRLIKAHVWEKPFMKRIDEIRSQGPLLHGRLVFAVAFLSCFQLLFVVVFIVVVTYLILTIKLHSRRRI
eukprot:GCRY01004495.1.p1 GENE.GCRY01004495.1~~GCRY01004495.1.p1  ORF type:complete len:386 (-),score=25.60 GCRY01004495.1:84-1160(-)